jgi:hypothetical protein
VTRREQCRPVLEAEVKRWSAMPWEQLVSELADERNDQDYQLQVDSTTYQVEVTLAENTDTYVFVVISVDDGSFWAACNPLSKGFRVEKHPTRHPPPPR